MNEIVRWKNPYIERNGAWQKGDFYCHYGVEILDLGRNDHSLFVYTKNARRIRFIGCGGKLIKEISGMRAHLQFRDDQYHSYIRIECLGERGEISWSQPFFRE